MAQLQQEDLHGALRDPVLQLPKFHTEIMTRYPDAISFAPGAPNLLFANDFDAARYTQRYLDHLHDDRGLSRQQARQLLYEYGPSRGLIGDLVAEALRRDQRIEVPLESIVITVGAQEGMLLLLRALCGSADDLIAVVNPCFIGFTGAARLLDAALVPIDETGDAVDLEQLAEACRDARAGGRRIRALYVAPDYANPSGTVLSLTARRELLDLAEREDFLIIEDSTYGFTVTPGAEIPSLKKLDQDQQVVSLGTFAKIALPGARVGFVVADQTVRLPSGGSRLLADELAMIKGMTTLHTPAVSQAVVAGMLLEHGGSLRELGAAKSELYRRNLTLLLEELDRNLSPNGWKWNRPTGGFFVRMQLPVRADAKLLELSASKYRVLWTPMSQFFLNGRGINEIRLSCSYLDAPEIAEGVRRLTDFLSDLEPKR